MAIVLNPYHHEEQWRTAMQRQMPGTDVWVWPECPDPNAVEYVVAWLLKRSDLASFPNLKAILNIGAGVDQWQKTGMPDVPIVRLVEPTMSNEMASYALHWVIRLQRRFDALADLQAKRQWKLIDYVAGPDFRVGILGYGTIGQRVGQAFVDLGYPVSAWSRSGTSDETVTSHAGEGGLESFLNSCHAVINVLPQTTETAGLLSPERLAQFRDGAVFINIGRGTVFVDEADLIGALDDGPLRAAVLDVTATEPLPEDSPLFLHPAIYLTPHVAGSTQIESAATVIAANIARIEADEEPFPLLDLSRGY